MGAAMIMLRLACAIGMTGLLMAFHAAAQEKSAPAKSEDISQGFRAFIVNEPRFPMEDVRNRTGKIQDLVTDHGLNPVIAVFSRVIPADAAHPLAAVVRKLDELADAKEYKLRRLGTYVVFLSLKDEFRKDQTRDARINEIKQFASGVMPKRTTFALAEATETPDNTVEPLVPAQVTAMGIAPEDDIVIVFYNNFKVVKRWKFKAANPPGDNDLKDLEAQVQKLLGPRKK
jgi:hypothetical protein